MQATARMASVVSSTLPARRRLIRDVRQTDVNLHVVAEVFVLLFEPLESFEKFPASICPLGVDGQISITDAVEFLIAARRSEDAGVRVVVGKHGEQVGCSKRAVGRWLCYRRSARPVR